MHIISEDVLAYLGEGFSVKKTLFVSTTRHKLFALHMQMEFDAKTTSNWCLLSEFLYMVCIWIWMVCSGECCRAKLNWKHDSDLPLSNKHSLDKMTAQPKNQPNTLQRKFQPLSATTQRLWRLGKQLQIMTLYFRHIAPTTGIIFVCMCNRYCLVFVFMRKNSMESLALCWLCDTLPICQMMCVRCSSISERLDFFFFNETSRIVKATRGVRFNLK